MNYRQKIRKAIECLQFGNEGYGEWGALRYDQRVLIKRLLDELDSADDYILKMQKEKQELKKQLEEMDSKLFFTKNELEMRQKTIDNKLRQQKEFINWLENIINNLEKEQSKRFNHTYEYKIETFKIALSKYKEIVGSDK